MAKAVVVQVPHNTAQDIAARKVDAFIRQLLNQHAAKIEAFDAAWDLYRLEARIRAMGQSLTGTIDVDAATVSIRLQLPLMMSLVSKQVETFLVSRCAQLFPAA